MHRARLALAVAVAGAALTSGAAFVGAQDSDGDDPLLVTIRGEANEVIGGATIRRNGATLDIRVQTRQGLRTGLHAMHLHSVGRCELPGFTSAGGHLRTEGQQHGAHAGDLPMLLVKRNGTSYLRVTTDLIAFGDLRDADGSALIIHTGRDNAANVPARYGGPDQETLDGGDSGSRTGCGVVAPSSG